MLPGAPGPTTSNKKLLVKSQAPRCFKSTLPAVSGAEQEAKANAVVKEVLKMATPARWKVRDKALISSNFDVWR